jgi:hypothetical protein
MTPQQRVQALEAIVEDALVEERKQYVKLENERRLLLGEYEKLRDENSRYRAALDRIAGHTVDWASEIAKRGLKE